MKHFRMLGIASILMCAGAASAGKANDAAPVSPALRQMQYCRGIANVSERAECYDHAFDMLQVSLRRREIVVVDPVEVARARRSLFGFNLPKLDMFKRGRTEADEAAFETLTSRIVQASRNGEGRWTFLLEDQARWVQSDDEALAVPARPDDLIRIRKGAMGSFLANVADQRAIRVRRIN